jgi:ketosteroid isomerase-like protein
MAAEVFMKNCIIILCILFTIPAFSYAQSKAQPQTAAKGKVKPNTDEFTTIIAEYYKAWNTLDLQNPAKYYDKDPSLVFYDIAPLKYQGWNEYQAGVKKLLADFSTFKLIPGNDLTVTRRGRVAWTTLTFHISGKQKNGTGMELDCRHTVIWEKQKGNWSIVHEHVSAPIPPAPAK